MLDDIKYDIEVLIEKIKKNDNKYSMDDIIDELEKVWDKVDDVNIKIQKEISDLEYERDYYQDAYHEEIGC